MTSGDLINMGTEFPDVEKAVFLFVLTGKKHDTMAYFLETGNFFSMCAFLTESFLLPQKPWKYSR